MDVAKELPVLVATSARRPTSRYQALAKRPTELKGMVATPARARGINSASVAVVEGREGGRTPLVWVRLCTGGWTGRYVAWAGPLGASTLRGKRPRRRIKGSELENDRRSEWIPGFTARSVPRSWTTALI